ncbi:unnamed protein product [Staurois parvus]|uniref:Sleeping Beauty transposase HTH domain-containing protein n=2 Tax=Staurois parvus TaxID=386267 RepID=A0ABN9F698_9NEOB|nr:unnamed protein product [Staurois parvus]
MQTASTNICERMGRSQELSEFKRGTVIGCHLCNKSIREISLLLNIPRSTVSGIKTKWKQLGTTAIPARLHWTLGQWRCVLWSDESRFSVWQSNGRFWVW